MFAPTVHLDRSDLPLLWEIVIHRNRQWIRRVGVRWAIAALVAVRFKIEPHDTLLRIWEIVASGRSDCEDIACAWCAVLRELGVWAVPVFVYQPGGRDHVVVGVGSERWDPSRAVHGMKESER